MKSLNEIADILKSKNCVYILTHQYPDGDTLGSAYGLCRALQALGKKAKVMYSGEIADKYKFMQEYVDEEEFTPEYIMSVDVAALKLIGDNLSEYKDNISLCIDHHVSNENYADVTFVDAMASATAEVIYNLILEFGLEIDKKIAECLYVGIATDTGCFKHSNVTARTHLITAELIGKNIDLERLNKNLFVMKSKKMLNLERMIYDNLQYHFDDRCALIKITKEMLDKCGLSDGNIDGVSSIPKCIEGVEIGLTFREKSENLYKVSVRTVGEINAMNICKQHGGGGHIHAAGCEVTGSFEEAKEKILNTIKRQLGW